MRERDSQRKKVYDAEDAAFPGMGSGRRDDRIDTTAEIAAWLTDIFGTRWFRNRYPNTAARPVTADRDVWLGTVTPMLFIANGQGTRVARGERHRLNLPSWARTKPTILHELAHTVCLNDVPRYSRMQPHGREFCQVYLTLIGRFMGAEAKRALKREFVARNVKSTPKREGRKLSPEERAAAAERLAAGRAARKATLKQRRDR